VYNACLCRNVRVERAAGGCGTLPFVNYVHRSAHCNVVKGPRIGTRDRSRRWQNDKRFDRGEWGRFFAIVVARHAASVLLWKCGFRVGGTRRMHKTIDQARNGRAFRDREFFTRIIRLRQDPPIRYRAGRILFSFSERARDRASYFRIQWRTYGTGFQDLHEIISTLHYAHFSIEISRNDGTVIVNCEQTSKYFEKNETRKISFLGKFA